MTSGLPTAILEQRAADQRRRLHDSVAELRATVRGTIKHKLDFRRNAQEYSRRHLPQAAAAAAVVGLAFGWAVGGIFTA
jgi:hypothetical protein